MVAVAFIGSLNHHRVSHVFTLLARAQAWAVLQGLGDVRRLDDVAIGEVGDGAGELEDAVEGAGGELETLGGGLEEGLRGGIYNAVFADLSWPHVGVAGDAAAGEALCLTLAGRLHASRALPPFARAARWPCGIRIQWCKRSSLARPYMLR